MAKKTIEDYRKENQMLKRLVKDLVVTHLNGQVWYWREFVGDKMTDRCIKAVPSLEEY